VKDMTIRCREDDGRERPRLRCALWLAVVEASVFLAAAPAPGADTAMHVERIVFSSDRSGAWRIWIVNADGSNMKQLTHGPEGVADVDPSFSPDASRVLFTSTRGGKPGVWSMQTNAAAMTRLCDGDQAEWAPEGQSIVFRRREQIFIRRLDSGRERRISPQGWPHCSGPSWSPDGKRIAFACRWERGNGIFVVPVEGGEPVRVYDKRGACEPHWSPDGTELLYETETHVCAIRPDGTKNRTITFYGGVQRYPRWSPDGRFVVFCQGPSPEGPWELYVVSRYGGRPRRLTTRGSDMYPDWR